MTAKKSTPEAAPPKPKVTLQDVYDALCEGDPRVSINSAKILCLEGGAKKQGKAA